MVKNLNTLKKRKQNIENIQSIAQLEYFLSKLYGQCLIYIEKRLFPSYKIPIIPHKFLVSNKLISNKKQNKYLDLYSTYTHLPFADDSIDIIVTPYLREYENYHQSIINEFFRTLKPNGYLFIVGVDLNPSKRNNFKYFFSLLSRVTNFYILCNKIKQAGGIIIEKKYFYELTKSQSDHLRPFYSKLWHRIKLVKHHNYLIMAQKRVYAVPLIQIRKPIMVLKNLRYVKS